MGQLVVDMLAYTFVVLILSSFCFGGDITSPEECEEWYAGYTYTIRWETDDLDDTVTIQFYEDDDTLVEEIVSSTENDGEYEWTVPFYQTTYDDCDPYIFVFSTSGYEFDYFITGDDAARSEPFTIITPIVFGSPNGGQPYNVADTLFKIRWSGPKVLHFNVFFSSTEEEVNLLICRFIVMILNIENKVHPITVQQSHTNMIKTLMKI